MRACVAIVRSVIKLGNSNARQGENLLVAVPQIYRLGEEKNEFLRQ